MYTSFFLPHHPSLTPKSLCWIHMGDKGVVMDNDCADDPGFIKVRWSNGNITYESPYVIRHVRMAAPFFAKGNPIFDSEFVPVTYAVTCRQTLIKQDTLRIGDLLKLQLFDGFKCKPWKQSVSKVALPQSRLMVAKLQWCVAASQLPYDLLQLIANSLDVQSYHVCNVLPYGSIGRITGFRPYELKSLYAPSHLRGNSSNCEVGKPEIFCEFYTDKHANNRYCEKWKNWDVTSEQSCFVHYLTLSLSDALRMRKVYCNHIVDFAALESARLQDSQPVARRTRSRSKANDAKVIGACKRVLK